MTHEQNSRNSSELVTARARNVDPHFMPDVVPLTRVAGGVASSGRNSLAVVRRMQCHGGAARNADFHGRGTGIMAECGSCGTNVYWEERLKVWVAEQS